MDDLNEIRKEIAYRRWQLTGCDDRDINWNEAGKILVHFLHRRKDSYYWKLDHEDYAPLYGDLVGEYNESDTGQLAP